MSLDARVLIPSWAFGGGDIRFSEALAGGTMMDAVRWAVGGSWQRVPKRLQWRVRPYSSTWCLNCLTPRHKQCTTACDPPHATLLTFPGLLLRARDAFLPGGGAHRGALRGCQGRAAWL